MPTVTNNINVSAVGASILNSADPSAVSWIRVNADNTITYRTAAETLSDLGAQAAGTYLVPADIGVTVQGYNANTTILGNSVTGSGSIVLATSPTIATSFTLDYGTASTVVYLNASKQLISLANGSGALTNDGSGGLTWAAASSGITINSTTITGGGANRILFENSSNKVSESVNELYFTSSSPYSHIFAAGRTATLTGLNNTLMGYRSGRDLTTGADNIYIGFQAGVTATNHTNNVVITTMSAAAGTQGSNNTLVGYRLETGGSHNTMIGGQGGTSNAVTGSNNVFLGYNTTVNAYSGQYNLVLGRSAGFYSTGGISGSISLNSTQGCTASNQMVIGSNVDGVNNSITQVYIGAGVTNTTAPNVTINATGGSGTNNAGANITIAGGKSTGTAAGGYVKSTTSVKGASGTTQQSNTDRNVIVGKYVDITESAATTFGTLALTTSGTTSGGEVMYTIEANDGTDYQSLTGVLKYDVVNKAGTLTVTYSDVQNGAGACSAGTLTATVTAAVSGTSIQFQANAVSSLAQTVLRVSFQVINNFGVATIAPA
ncbi:MAG TPA: hypothetical protein PLD87_10145 [Bacteroidia bacterium]|nr:hypothetical protein [Bacteroidia bacterium]